MPFLYNCTACPKPVDLGRKLSRSDVVDCPECAKRNNVVPTKITHKRLHIDNDPYKNTNMVAPKKNKATASPVAVAPGRSPAAPVRTDWPGQNLHASVTHVQSLTSAAWTNAANDKIYLAYRDLDITRSGVEGLIIDCPQMVNRKVDGHFITLKVKLEAAHKPPDVAEATGEAAAALCILCETRLGGAQGIPLAGFNMEWGMDVHSGAGIDQIWKWPDPQNNSHTYLIVEAKGPNQSLSPNKDMPDDFEQMGTRWIMHNLITMQKQAQHPAHPKPSHQVGADILSELKLNTGPRWPFFGGASKSYYGVTGAAGLAIAKLYKVVVTAKWNADGRLEYTPSDFEEMTNFTF